MYNQSSDADISGGRGKGEERRGGRGKRGGGGSYNAERRSDRRHALWWDFPNNATRKLSAQTVSPNIVSSYFTG